MYRIFTPTKETNNNLKLKIMNVFANLSNGNQSQITLIGDNAQIIKFIENYEGSDLGNDIILQDFIEDFIETGVIIEADQETLTDIQKIHSVSKNTEAYDIGVEIRTHIDAYNAQGFENFKTIQSFFDASITKMINSITKNIHTKFGGAGMLTIDQILIACGFIDGSVRA